MPGAAQGVPLATITTTMIMTRDAPPPQLPHRQHGANELFLCKVGRGEGSSFSERAIYFEKLSCLVA